MTSTPAVGYLPISSELLGDLATFPPLHVWFLPEPQQQQVLLAYQKSKSVGFMEPSATVAEGFEQPFRWDDDYRLHYLGWEVPECICCDGTCT